MNYYERIQRSIDYIEKNIQIDIILEDVATEASMSLSNFYRIFFALAGYSVKEYIRLRRISLAGDDLQDETQKISEIAKKYSYTSADSFSRTFKKVTGILPSEYRNSQKGFSFEKIDLYDKYFAAQDTDLLQKYPDIKVLKILDPFFVASYSAFSRTPEVDAFCGLKKWATKNELLSGDGSYRIFGFDIPDSLQNDGTYGYEVWITVPGDYPVHDDKISLKKCPGGLYAVTSTTIGDIVSTWNRFREWLKLSRYEMGDHQCLEEHLPFEEWENDHPQTSMKIDLYMPLQQNAGKTREIISPVRVAFFRAEGNDREKNAMKVWDVMLHWAKKNKLTPSAHRIFMYNMGFKKSTKYWHEIMITIPDDFSFQDDVVKEKMFNGGKYMTMKTDPIHLRKTWHEMGKWKIVSGTKSSRHQWIEEWLLNDWHFPCNGVRVFYPISE